MYVIKHISRILILDTKNEAFQAPKSSGLPPSPHSVPTGQRAQDFLWDETSRVACWWRCTAKLKITAISSTRRTDKTPMVASSNENTHTHTYGHSNYTSVEVTPDAFPSGTSDSLHFILFLMHSVLHVVANVTNTETPESEPCPLLSHRNTHVRRPTALRQRDQRNGQKIIDSSS